MALVILCGLLISHVTGRPTVQFDPGTASDLRQVAWQAWSDLESVFDDRLRCAGNVTVRAVDDLDVQGRYDDRIISIRVPIYESTATNTFLHEFGHHLEQRCPDQVAIRPAFTAAQGLDPATPWFGGDAWEHSPSEMWSEAVSLVVSGRQQRSNLVPVTDQALAVVAAWAAGDDPGGVDR